MKGFILTRQWRDTPAGIQLDIWLASDDGPIQLLIPEQSAVCFCRKDDFSSLSAFFSQYPGLTTKYVNLKNYHNDILFALYFPRQRQLRDFQQQCERHAIPLWEFDIKPHDRFLMERFITSELLIKIDQSSAVSMSTHYNYQQISTQQVKATSYQPTLRMLSLDIETSLDAKQLYSVGVYNNDTAIVFMVDPAVDENNQVAQQNGFTIRYYASASLCLHHFFRWFHDYDPDIIIGWHIVQFDLWVLETLCRELNIPFALGRAKQTLHWREERDPATGKIDRRYAQVPGRIVLDGIELLKTAFYQFERFSLEFVAQAILGEGKLLDSDDRGQAITQLYQDNKSALATYNLQDCKLVWDIFEKTKLLDFAIERSRLTGLSMDRIGGSVASFDYAYLPRLHRLGYVAPNLGELQSNIVSPGGYVMRSKPGLYRNVLVLDFKSLYPSIIRTFCIDPYAFWFAEHEGLSKDQTVSGFNGAHFAREGSILPQLIADLWQAREKAKAEKNQPLSQAIKIIMNSFYGVLGSTGCRFYDPRVCSSITLRGHEVIQCSRDWIIEQGYDVIYGDTDSLFIWLGEQEPVEVLEKIGVELAQSLNQWWQERLKKIFNIESALEVEFETHYTHFLMPTIRGSSEGSKKRYAGIIHQKIDGELKEKLIFKGLETVRNDWTQLAKKFQQDLYVKIFKQEAYRDSIRQTVKKLLAGELDELLIYRKRLRRSLKEYKKSNPPHVKAARLLQQRGDILLGRGAYIEYIITVNGPEPIQCQLSRIDYQHYVDKQLKPVANSILSFVEDQFEKIIDQQITLL